MLLNMSHPPTLPSHSGPPRIHNAFSGVLALSSRPEPFAGGQHNPPRESSNSLNNAQQLPSLRTLLEPELLDNKTAEPPTGATGGTQNSYTNGSAHLETASPTLKRRHDFYVRGYPEQHNIAHQTSYSHRQPFPLPVNDAASTTNSIPNSVYPNSQLELQRRESFAITSNHDLRGHGFRSSSSASDPIVPFSSYPNQDDKDESDRPVRRRIDVSSRGSIRQSRLIGQRDIPGEGSCYIYEDGTYCRAVIDGEPVNPSWGITKAGKPRKRLAQACLTCREKKIKCEPDFPKCHQCAKSQRVCRG